MAAFTADIRGVTVVCGSCGQKNRILFERLADSGQCGKCGCALDTLSSPVEIPGKKVFDSLVKTSGIPVLVDFWTAWCGPCRMVAPELEKVAKSNKGRLVVAKVNTEEIPELAQRFNVSGIPLLVLFRDGQEVSRLPGARPASAIESFVWQAKT